MAKPDSDNGNLWWVGNGLGRPKETKTAYCAYGDGAYTDEDYQRRIDEIDAKIASNIPVLMPSIDEAGNLIDDLPGMWREALPEERHRWWTGCIWI